MPELAEVEHHRRRWNPGLDHVVAKVLVHPRTRVFRGVNTRQLQRALAGSKLLSSEARGKQMVFRFSGDQWLGVHLGMTGEMRCEPATCRAGIHDHLALVQSGRCLVFRDPRQFGRIRWHQGAHAPKWWSCIPPALTSRQFTTDRLAEVLHRHRRAPLKALLLRQECFPGIGNWMADEILWRARLRPRRVAGTLTSAETNELWRCVRFVCRGAMRIVAMDYSDPPPQWLFRHRWQAGGKCPADGTLLERATIGGRTTAWCAQCQG